MVRTKTLRLFTSEGRALTNLTAEDPTLTLPDEIHVDPVTSCATACHADQGDTTFLSLVALAEAYTLESAEVEALLDTEGFTVER